MSTRNDIKSLSKGRKNSKTGKEDKTSVLKTKSLKQEASQQEGASKPSEEVIEKENKPSSMKKKPQHQLFPINDSVSNNIEKFLKQNEQKKKEKESEIRMLGKKTKRTKKNRTQKPRAKDYQNILNTYIRPSHFISLTEINAKDIIPNTEVLLSLIEIAVNSSYYMIAFSNTSKMFWKNIVQYNELKHIFAGYNPKTLRKCWMLLSTFDVEKICDLIQQKRKFLESIPLTVSTLANTLALFLEGKITDIEEYIKKMNQEYQNPETEEITTIKDVHTTIRKRKRYEPGHKPQFIEKNDENQELEEVCAENDQGTQDQIGIKQLTDENPTKLRRFREFTEEERKRLIFIKKNYPLFIPTLIKVCEKMSKEFKISSCGYLCSVLVENSMDIQLTYQSLRNSTRRGSVNSESDDEKITTKRGGDKYETLIYEKGVERKLS